MRYITGVMRTRVLSHSLQFWDRGCFQLFRWTLLEVSYTEWIVEPVKYHSQSISRDDSVRRHLPAGLCVVERGFC